MSAQTLTRIRVALMALRHARSSPGTASLCEDVLRDVEAVLTTSEWRDLPPVSRRGSQHQDRSASLPAFLR